MKNAAVVTAVVVCVSVLVDGGVGDRVLAAMVTAPHGGGRRLSEMHDWVVCMSSRCSADSHVRLPISFKAISLVQKRATLPWATKAIHSKEGSHCFGERAAAKGGGPKVATYWTSRDTLVGARNGIQHEARLGVARDCGSFGGLPATSRGSSEETRETRGPLANGS